MAHLCRHSAAHEIITPGGFDSSAIAILELLFLVGWGRLGRWRRSPLHSRTFGVSMTSNHGMPEAASPAVMTCLQMLPNVPWSGWQCSLPTENHSCAEPPCAMQRCTCTHVSDCSHEVFTTRVSILLTSANAKPNLLLKSWSVTFPCCTLWSI